MPKKRVMPHPCKKKLLSMASKRMVIDGSLGAYLF